MPSLIPWCEEYWNAITGCTKISEGCRNCYIYRLGRWLGWAEVVTCHEDRLVIPYRWKEPRLIFANSRSDFFHEDVPTDFIDRMLRVMVETPRHSYQVLTKRPERMQALLKRRSWRKPHHCWFGVSVENQKRADERIPVLLETSASIRFLSVEPLLEPVDLRLTRSRGIDWVIVGGESGSRSKARPCDLDWIRDIMHQCELARVPVFVKQVGRNPVGASGIRDPKGEDPTEWPLDLRLRQYPPQVIAA